MRLLLCLCVTLLCGCSGSAPPPKDGARTDLPGVKITQFYANPTGIPKGEKSLLCYGVESASAVRIQPPVEDLSPALTRCFEVRPQATTTYTLTAEGRSGGSASQSVTVRVGGAAPALFDLAINKTSVKPGELVSFCFQAKNATSVRGGPGKFQRGGAANKDCLVDQPTKTTTYEIIVSNSDGLTDKADMTVKVAL